MKNLTKIGEGEVYELTFDYCLERAKSLSRKCSCQKDATYIEFSSLHGMYGPTYDIWRTKPSFPKLTSKSRIEEFWEKNSHDSHAMIIFKCI